MSLQQSFVIWSSSKAAYSDNHIEPSQPSQLRGINRLRPSSRSVVLNGKDKNASGAHLFKMRPGERSSLDLSMRPIEAATDRTIAVSKALANNPLSLFHVEYRRGAHSASAQTHLRDVFFMTCYGGAVSSERRELDIWTWLLQGDEAYSRFRSDLSSGKVKFNTENEEVFVGLEWDGMLSLGCTAIQKPGDWRYEIRRLHNETVNKLKQEGISHKWELAHRIPIIVYLIRPRAVIVNTNEPQAGPDASTQQRSTPS